MQLTLATLIASAAALVSATSQSLCAEATQFGVLSVFPTNVSAGDTLSISSNFDCAIKYFGIIPTYTDYYIEPENNNGHEPEILLARRNFSRSFIDTDLFTVQVPYANYSEGAHYKVLLDITYPVNGTNGTPYYVVDGTQTNITINASN